MKALPIIDLTGLPEPSALVRVADEIRKATADCGFFYIAGHGISRTLIQRLRNTQRALFDLNISQKQTITINQFNRGYLSAGEARMHGSKTHDQKEVFFWGAELAPDHPDIVHGTPLCGPNQWPAELPEFRSTVLEYAESVQITGNRLLQAIAVSLDVSPDFFAPFYQDSLLRGQLIRYPQTVGDANHFGVAPHSDFGCITLLLQETPGLEVLMGDDWVEAPPVEGTLVVNIGDLLERWTDQRLPSTRHRVRNRDTNARYSIAMFHDPSPNAIVDPRDLDVSIVEGRYEPIGAADYIMSRNQGAFAHYGADTSAVTTTASGTSETGNNR